MGPLAPTLRLFLALWPGPALRERLALEQARWRLPPTARAVAAASLHLTLHYIGPLPATRLAAVAPELAVRAGRFTLRLSQHERWPNHCAVLCPAALPAALIDLHAMLAEALRALALPVQARPFRPHVTLARRAAAATPPEPPPRGLAWPVRGYALVHSQGGRYIPLARYACG